MKFIATSWIVLLVFSVSTAADKKSDFDTLTGSRMAGRVLAVTETSITIAKTEGKKKEEVVTYLFHDRLASGSFNQLASDPFAYSAKDLEVGDIVTLHVMNLDDKRDFCVSLKIYLRPDGKIPPSQKPDPKVPYHAQRNAYIDFEKNGTPVPAHLSAGSRTPPPKEPKKPGSLDPEPFVPFPKGWKLF